MAVFQINLAKSRVIPAARRRIWYRVLMLYLACSGLILVLLAGGVTRHLIAASDRRQQVWRLEQQVLQSCPGHKDIAGYAAQTGANMTHYAEALETVLGVLRRPTSVAAIIYGLAAPLPREMTINNMELDAGKGEIAFEVWIPENGSVADMTPPNLVSVWSQDPLLKAEVTQLTSAGNQRTQMNGHGFSVWHFTGRLAKNGD